MKKKFETLKSAKFENLQSNKMRKIIGGNCPRTWTFNDNTGQVTYDSTDCPEESQV